MSNNYSAIPDELKVLNQWICWRYEDIGARKPTKVPYNPVTNKHADVNKPETWVSFECATSALGYDGIGFVFSEDDPYTFIDLDNCRFLSNGDINPKYEVDLNRQIQIFNEFESYSEISPSGEGLHVIVKGKVAAGRKRSFIEIYSSQRYATFTGHAYKHTHIKDRQDILTQLWEQLGSGQVMTYCYEGDEIERITDENILQQAKDAVNGDKFNHLLFGNWQHLYTSQSEADFAFIDILAFYTQNRKQINRIFLSSPLGKRTKAKRKDYVEWMINKSFDKMLPPIDFDGFANRIAEKQSKLKLPIPVQEVLEEQQSELNNQHSTIYEIPPGLLGEIAQFIYQAAPLPVPEIALAAAIGLMAGIAGRAYNVNGEGLNQYILLIAQSGTGKEAMASGIDKLMNLVKLQVPTSNRVIGPGEITSGEALIKHLNTTSQCFVSILSEFGYRLQALSDKRDRSQSTLKRMLLELYHKSGKGRIFQPKIYSDKDKNISETISPSFSILAETTPSTFYECLTEEMIADGFLTRFSIIEYKGIRVDLNEQCALIYPPNWLIEKLSSFVATCETLNHHKRVIDVKITKEAKDELSKFGKYATNMINKNDKEDIRQLWNRAHIKAWRLAGLIAVGINMIEPEITLDNIKWALNIVYNDINKLSQKFESGEIGTTNLEIRQKEDLIRAIKDYFNKEKNVVEKYRVNKVLYNNKVVSYQYLSAKLLQMASYRNDKIGGTNALKRSLQMLLDTDKIREVGKQELAIKYGTTQRSFVVVDVELLD